VEYLGFDLGELFDTADLLPTDLLYYEDDEDDDAHPQKPMCHPIAGPCGVPRA
jgi:hypothetical protein